MENATSLSDALNRAWSLLTTGNVDAAGKLYDAILAKQPDCIEGVHGLALVHFKQGRHDLAVHDIGRVFEAKTENPRHANTAGVICQGCGEVDSALTHYKTALELIDKSKDVQEQSHQDLREEVLQNLRSLALFAEASYEELVPIHLNQGDPVGAAILKFKVGNLCQEVDWVPRAIFHYREGLSFRPSLDPGAMVPLAADGGASEVLDLSKGQACWQTPIPQHTTLQLGQDPAPVAIAQDTIFAHLYQKLAEAHARQFQWDQVKIASQNALQINSKHHEAYRLLGDALMNQKQLQPAVDAYQAALQINSKYVEGWFHLGSALLSASKLDEAMKCYREVLALDPKHARTHWNIGLIYDRQKNTPQALQYWQAAMHAVEETREAKADALNIKAGMVPFVFEVHVDESSYSPDFRFQKSEIDEFARESMIPNYEDRLRRFVPSSHEIDASRERSESEDSAPNGADRHLTSKE
ncbi:MAG: tetratricopeptide repeat protein, partial [Cyanobacteria bacterium P01_H01_bin.130]